MADAGCNRQYFADVVEDLAHGSEMIDEGDDAHGGVADRALQRKCLIDARQQHGLQIAGHGTMTGLLAGCPRSCRPAKRHPRRARCWRWRNGGRGLRRHHRAQRRIGREHTIVAMAMSTRRRHQGGDLRDQFEWRQHQRHQACTGRCSERRLGGCGKPDARHRVGTDAPARKANGHSGAAQLANPVRVPSGRHPRCVPSHPPIHSGLANVFCSLSPLRRGFIRNRRRASRSPFRWRHPCRSDRA